MSRHSLLMILAVALVVWGAVGLYQGLHSGFSGGFYDPDYIVSGIEQGGLAAKAGFHPGDRVISVEGRPVEELGMESRWPRSLAPRVGQSLRFIVERKGEKVPVDVVYGPPSPNAVRTRVTAAVIGLAFLGFGLWAFLTVGTPAAGALARVGFAAGAATSLGLGPSLGAWNGVPSHIGAACNLLMLILLFQFFLSFPDPKRISRSRLATGALYAAWVLFVAVQIVELIVHPALYYTTGSIALFLALGYCALILAAVTHTVVTIPRGKLWESGMGLILVGFLAPIAALGSTFVFRLPGSAHFPLLLLAFPLTLALAVRKQA